MKAACWGRLGRWGRFGLPGCFAATLARLGTSTASNWLLAIRIFEFTAPVLSALLT